MSNVLFNRSQQLSNNGFINTVNQLKANGPSNLVFENMYKSNPGFRRFADSVRNKSPEEAFRQYGLDFRQFKGLKW